MLQANEVCLCPGCLRITPCFGFCAIINTQTHWILEFNTLMGSILRAFSILGLCELNIYLDGLKFALCGSRYLHLCKVETIDDFTLLIQTAIDQLHERFTAFFYDSKYIIKYIKLINIFLTFKILQFKSNLLPYKNKIINKN